MKEWPKKINLFGRKLVIKYFKDSRLVDEDRRGGHLAGQYYGPKNEIRILKGNDKDDIKQPIQIFETILHEMIHGVFDGCTALSRMIDKDDYEDFIHEFGVVLAYALITNNMIELPEV